ncbi:phage tail tape measure protein [Paenibacillus lautus]
MSDAHVRLKADDQVSPLIDSISAKISGLAALGSGLVLGGGVSGSLFGGVGDYYKEASRLAPYLSAQQWDDVLVTNDKLVAQDLISDRATGASGLSTLVPMVQDKSKVSEAFSATTKLQAVIPDSGSEEIQRAVTQTAKNFNETYTQVADSMAYAYKSVGDPQKDLADTFWEYSPYFASAGTSSAQMSNFLSKTVQEGAFNFDKPGDFFKEVFGVKALNTDDMVNYFINRGSGKDDAQRQATAFTADINSENAQQAQGAIAALLADLASQDRNTLKQSLTQLGSATGEDNADAILKTYGVAFEKAPDMTGTTDRLVSAQQAADPLTEYRQTQNQMKVQLQDIGGTIMQASLPAMQEFNALLVENKNEIAAFGKGVADFIADVTGFYKDHTGMVNTALIGLSSVLVLKGLTSLTKGLKKFSNEVADAGKWVWNRVPGTRKFSGGKGSPIDGTDLQSVSTMNVSAGRVYITGNVGGNGGEGGSRRGNKNRRRERNQVISTPDIDRPLTNQSNANKPVKGKTSRGISLGSGAKGVMRAGGVLGFVGGTAIGAYDLYTVAKEEGFKEAVSTRGGSVVGGVAGGAIGGIVGSIAGPIGSMIGASVGNFVGEKVGNWFDDSGITRKVVDTFSNITSNVSNWASNTADTIKNTMGSWKDTAAGWLGIGKKEPPPEAPRPESKLTFTGTAENQVKVETALKDFYKDVGQKGMKEAISDVVNDSGVKTVMDGLKSSFSNIWENSKAKAAQEDIKGVGAEAQKAGEKTKNLAQTSKSSTQEIVTGARDAGQSFSGVSSAAGNAASQTKQHLQSIQHVVSQGSSWGSNLISMMADGMRNKFPSLTSVVSQAAGVIKNYLGFSSPTKEGPASNSDKWAVNFVNMFADGLNPVRIRERMSLIAGTMRDEIDGVEGPNIPNGSIPLRTTPLTEQGATGTKTVSIGNITMDFGGLAAGITDFQSFAKALTSPEGRALIRQVFGEELYKALETGG